MGWSAPVELNNYTFIANVNRPGSGSASCGVCTYKTWLGAEDMAWICNQDDACWGFIKNKGNGGWLISRYSLAGQTSSTTTDIYQKKSTTWRKANNPDTSVEGVLANPATRFRARDSSTTADVVSVTPGLYCAGNAGYSKANSLDTYIVPLGWKFMFSNDNIGQSDVEGYWDRGGAGRPGNFTLDSPNYHGMMNKDDCVLVQNIGFDVAANWNSMTNVDGNDQNTIKYNWCMNNPTHNLCNQIIETYCLSSVANMQGDKCYAKLADITAICLRNKGTAETAACRSTNPFLGPVFTTINSNYKRYNRLRTFDNLGSYQGLSPNNIGQSSAEGACNVTNSCPGYAVSQFFTYGNSVPDTGETLVSATEVRTADYFQWYQKVKKDCAYTDPGASACTNQCTRTLNITQQAQMGGTACPTNPAACSDNQGQCCTSVLTGASAGRGSFTNTGSGCQLTCNSPYYGTNCSNWCPRTGGWGLDYPADGTVGNATAYAIVNGVRQIVTPLSKASALLYTSDGWGGTWNAGTPNSSCNGTPTCGAFVNGLGSWYTSGSDTGNPCRYAQCNTDIAVANGTRNVLAACAAVCNVLPNGHGVYTGSTCATASCYSWSSTLNGVTAVTGNYTGATCDTLTCNTDIPSAQGYRRASDCMSVCSAFANGLGTWSGLACAAQACYTVTVTVNGVTTTAGQFGGTNCTTLTCNSGYTKTSAGNRCCPTPSGVTNPIIYTDATNRCIVSNCPRLANNQGIMTAVPDGGCTGTPVCDRLASGTGGYTGSTCATLTCDAGDTRKSYTGASCTLTCNRTPNNRGVYSGTNCASVTCDRLPSGKGTYSGADCASVTCDTDLGQYGVRSGSDCLTVTCNRITNGTYGPAGVCTGTPVCDRLTNNLGIYRLFQAIGVISCSPTYNQPVCDSISNGVRLPGPNNDCTVINCNTVQFGTRSGASCTLACNQGYSLSSSGTKCCKTVQGAQSYDDTTCNPLTDCVLKQIGPDDFWSACSTMVCGQTGTQTRTRVIDTAAAYGGLACAATLDRRTETDATRLARGALSETRACTPTCTDMKELPKDTAVTKCAADANCKVIGFEENAGFSLYSTVSTSNSSPYNYDALFVKTGTTAPTVSATKETPTGYIVQASKKYSNIIPISQYVNPDAIAPGNCIRLEDQCTLDSQCVGFDINSSGQCSLLMTNMTDLSNVARWSNTTNASVTTYLKS